MRNKLLHVLSFLLLLPTIDAACDPKTQCGRRNHIFYPAVTSMRFSTNDCELHNAFAFHICPNGLATYFCDGGPVKTGLIMVRAG